MFTRPDNTYNDIREKSLMQWLDEMEQHSDVAVRGGVKLTREYVQHLQEEIRRLEEENRLKAQYLKKMKEKITVNNNSNNYCYYIDDGIGFSYNTNKEIDGRNQNE